MNEKHVKGSINQVKGKIKENIGHATGDSKLEGEGILDRTKGKIQEGLGDLKDKVKKGIDSVLDKNNRKTA
jgi:uncharacterized protein YjbJ (UPF0337 family)